MSRYRKLFALLLVTLILASAAIAWAGWQAIAQQRELDGTAQERRIKERAGEIGRDMIARLNDVKLQAITQDPFSFEVSSVPGLALTGWLHDGRLTYAWDAQPLTSQAQAFDQAIHDPEIASKKAEADRADARNDYAREIEIYRNLLDKRDPHQREFVRLLLAAAYMRASRESEGLELYREILNLGSDVVDENGLPLSLYRDGYAVHALLKTHAPKLEREVLNRVNREIQSLPDLARTAAFVKPILDALAKSADAQVRTDTQSGMERLQQRIEYLERMRSLPQARRLQAEFGSLGVRPMTWQAFSDAETWLIGMTPDKGGRAIVIAVRSDDIRNRISSELRQPIEFELDGKSGEPLHENLPGLRLNLPIVSQEREG